MEVKDLEKLVPILHIKNEYFIYITDWKQDVSHELVFKKFIEWLNLIKLLC